MNRPKWSERYTMNPDLDQAAGLAGLLLLLGFVGAFVRTWLKVRNRRRTAPTNIVHTSLAPWTFFFGWTIVLGAAYIASINVGQSLDFAFAPLLVPMFAVGILIRSKLPRSRNWKTDWKFWKWRRN